MKRAVILHAMDQTSQGHWYPWLKSELEKRGYQVWVPDLPHTSKPDTREMTAYLMGNKDWDFTDNLIIGHSSGSVELLYLLQALQVKVKTAVMVSSFDKMVPGMEDQHALVFQDPFNFRKIASSAEKLLFVHGDDDPWCPVSGAENLAKEPNSELILIPGGKHFSTSLDPAYTEFPKLVSILEERGRL
jgi:predicted alpha/beta hydrolase family esterase